ncbi:MAG: 3-hydroxyacyl-CoA dehydrogenase NAD-binding domain-containing protein [Pseudomonadota bacterium]
MKHPVRLERRHGRALIAIENPPVNALGHAVRLGILAAFEVALHDDAVSSIILAANGHTFPAGADINEFDMPARAPSLPELCDIIEASPKPVIAALHGMVLGGGLELAMAAHYRIAHPGTQMGLPEIKLGLLPGAGGTQRAPRLMPVRDALDLMLTGDPIPAKRAQQLGLIDGIAEGDLRETVMMLAPELDQPRATRYLRHHLSDGVDFMAATSAARVGLKEDAEASKWIIECVEAALLVPFDAALQMEQEAFADCLASEASIGLRYAFFAERLAQKFPELKGVDATPVESVSIVGEGLISIAITIACLNCGLPVTLVSPGEAGVTLALDRIGDFYEREAQAGRITQTQGAGRLSKLNLTTDMGAVRQSDLIIESVSANVTLRETVLRKMGQIAKPSAVLCANRSDQEPGALAALTGRPAQSLALHFFAPTNSLNLVEIGVTDDVAPKAVGAALQLAKRMGKRPLRCQSRPGLVGDRMLSAYLDAADAFLLKGASPNQVDTAMRVYGMPQGPYEMQDRASVDLIQAKRLARAAPVLLLPSRMVQAGCVGRRVGQGYYKYHQAGHATPNEEVMHLLVAERREKRIDVAPSSASEIQNGLIAALINAGAALLEDGTAQTPGDIDTAMVHGMGFPREKGGPMYQANRVGAFEILRGLEHMQKAGPVFCEIASLLRKKAAERESFTK